MAGEQNPQQLPEFTELHRAALFGSGKEIRAALSSGSTTVDEANRHGMTALMFAALEGRLHAIKVLLEKGADVSMTDARGLTALHVAARQGQVDIARMLVKAGTHVEAAYLDGETPLHMASCQGHADVIRALIEAGANPDKRRISDGSTALYMACLSGSLDVVLELLRAKADPLMAKRASSGKYAEDRIPLEAAAVRGHSEVVRAMIRVTGIEGCGGASGGLRALGAAAHGDHLAVVKILTAAGVEDTGAALIKATIQGSGASVKFLLHQEDGRARSGGALVNSARDVHGNTPLFWAIVCTESSPRVARLLVDAGADTTSAVRIVAGNGSGWLNYTPMGLVMYRLGDAKEQAAGREEEVAIRKEVHRLEAVRRLLLQVEAARAVSWLWHRDLLSIDQNTAECERESREKAAAASMFVVLPILRRRASRRGVLLAAMERHSGKA